MSDNVTRQIKITGGAADDYHKQKGIRRSTRRRRYAEGGSGEAGVSNAAANAGANAAANAGANAGAGVSTNAGANAVPGPAIASPANYASAKVISASLMGGSASGTIKQIKAESHGTVEKVSKGFVDAVPKEVVASVSASAALSHSPVKTPSKLTLTPPKKAPKKVILAPPASHSKTSKVRETRKVRVHLSGLKKRLTRAKHISKESSEKPIAAIRKDLEEAKLIKPLDGDEKVPEKILRGLHRDYLLLRNRAL